MPISTDLSVSPYFNTYSVTNDYYRINFQPGVSVQTRELNELQSILQNQIEQFGDNIFLSGSIVSGCNFQPLSDYNYATINDVDNDGNNVNVSVLQGYTVQNDTSGLRGFIVNFADGFQTTAPNLKTLYVSYQNSGLSGNLTAFAPGDIVRVFDATINGIERISVVGGGIGFSNSDTVIAESSIVVSQTTGTVSVGDYISNGSGANVQVVSIDSTTKAATNQLILKIAPRVSDLTNVTPTTTSWTFAPNQPWVNQSNSASGVVTSVIGSGFVGKIKTDGVGSVLSIDVIQKGYGYTSIPYVTIQSQGSSSGNYSSLNISALNYVCNPVVSSVGQGYGFSITEGVIFQKGTFLRVNPQQIIISKYSNQPTNVAVSFTTNEQIVNYNIDSNLLDNAGQADQTNLQAPGADRLRLTPVLQITDAVTAASNSQLVTLATWQNGRMYQQTQQSTYNVIGNYVADRIDDITGDFVLDPWLVTTSSPLSANDEGQFVNIVVDPGTGYIDGFKVQTISNYQIEIEKGIQTSIQNNHSTSLNYGNYIVVQDLGGTFQFNTGDQVQLQDTAAQFITNIFSGTGTPVAVGNTIGTANIRSLQHQNGMPGTPGCTYLLYLYNVQMNAGTKFGDVRSVFYNGVHKGVADVVLQSSATSAFSAAVLNDTNLSKLVFDSGVESLKNANGISYTYKTIDQSVTIANNGIITKSIAGLSGQVYPYSGTLSSPQLTDFVVVPTSTDLVATTPLTGTVTTSTTSPNIIGSGTSFLTNLSSGDSIYLTSNSTGGHDLQRITNIVNNTFLVVGSNSSYANTTAQIYRAFPKNVPIPFGYRSGLTGSVDSTQQILTLNVGNTFSFAGAANVSLTTNITIANTVTGTKTANRNMFVKIFCGNNAGFIKGPWSLGVPDCFRLDGVYISTSNSVSNTGTNYVNNFFVKNGQTTDYYGLSTLNLEPKSIAPLTPSSYILVQFDYFTSSGSFFDTVSYLGSNSNNIFFNDSQSLATIGANVNSFEVPELVDNFGTEIDLLNQFDFRPAVANTVAPSTTANTAPINPAGGNVFDTTTEKYFPNPNSLMVAGQLEYYLGRTDSVYVDTDTRFSVVQGSANSIFAFRTASVNGPSNAMKLTNVAIPPYPNLPINKSVALTNILDNGMMQNGLTRNAVKTINNSNLLPNPSLGANNVLPYNQPRGYTQADIGNIDRRLTNVENELALTALEANVSNMSIPSSVSPSLNRFQYGFFVDNFTSNTYSDILNPQYDAQYDPTTKDIIPLKMSWDVSVAGNGPPSWIDSPIISQPIATNGSVTDPLGIGPVCAINLANTVAYQMMFRNGSDITSGTTDTVNVTLASSAVVTTTIQYVNTDLATYLAANPAEVASYAVGDGTVSGWNQSNLISDLRPHSYAHGGYSVSVLSQSAPQIASMPSGGTYVGTTYHPPVTLFFYCFDVPTAINIYQNGTLIATTDVTSSAATPQNLTQAEITLTEGSSAQGWFNVMPEFYMQNFTNAGGGYVSYAGKLTFNYDPSKGSNFTITTTSSAFVWRWILAYPINGSSIGCIPPQQFNDVSGTYTQNWESVYIRCGNGAGFYGQMFAGYTEQWNTIPIPAPQTVVVPFNINSDWTGAQG